MSHAITFLLVLLFSPKPVFATQPQAIEQCAALFTSDTILSIERDISWLPKPHVSRVILSETLPQGAKVSAAYVVASKGDQYLMARHQERGWDITGGHVNPGENPMAAAQREAFEETGSRITNLRLVGYQKIELWGEKPDGYAYDWPESYQAFYIGDVADVGQFQEDEDSVERGFFSFDEARTQIGWCQRNAWLFEAMHLLRLTEHFKTAVVYNGSFDPVHPGHAEAVLKALEIRQPAFAVVTGNNPSKSKLLRTPVHERTEMLRLQFAHSPHVFVSSLPIPVISHLLKGRVHRVGVIGSDQYLHHIATSKPPKLEVEEWLLTKRGSDKIPSVIDLFGRSVTLISPTELRMQGGSSSRVRDYLLSHLEVYAAPKLYEYDQAPIDPDVLTYIVRHKLYYPHELVEEVRSTILSKFAPSSTLELLSGGLSGDLVFAVRDANGSVQSIVKAFITPSYMLRMAQESYALAKLKQIPIKMTYQGERFAFIAMEPAKGVELRTAIRWLTAEARNSDAGFDELVKQVENMSYAVGVALAKLHLENAKHTQLSESDPWLQMLFTKLASHLKELHKLDPLSDLPRKIEVLKQSLLSQPVRLGITRGDANPGNFFYDQTTQKVSMIDLGQFSESGVVSYEYYQVLSSIDLLQVGDLDQEALNRVKQSFEKGYRSINSEVPHPFFKTYWRIRERISQLKR